LSIFIGLRIALALMEQSVDNCSYDYQWQKEIKTTEDFSTDDRDYEQTYRKLEPFTKHLAAFFRSKVPRIVLSRRPVRRWKPVRHP